jgi:hypothetical protein
MSLTYKGLKIADAGFVINLPERIERKNSTDKLLSEIGFSGYNFFNGVKILDESWRVFGCTQAYINLFEIALKENYNNIIVFEDDIKLMNSINTSQIDSIFNTFSIHSKNYDVIALGTRPLPGSKIIKETENFGKIYNLLSTHSFFYKKNFISYLYNSLKNYKLPKTLHYNCIIDEFINDCCSHNFVLKNKNKIFNIGITIPMVFTQNNSYSDNEMCIQEYDNWMEECFWNALNL